MILPPLCVFEKIATLNLVASPFLRGKIYILGELRKLQLQTGGVRFLLCRSNALTGFSHSKRIRYMLQLILELLRRYRIFVSCVMRL